MAFRVAALPGGPGNSGTSVADACPVACGRCTADNSTSITVVQKLQGEYRLKTTLLTAADVGPDSTPPALQVSAQDGIGIKLLGSRTQDVLEFRSNVPSQVPIAAGYPFTVVGVRKRATQYL